PQGTTTGPPPGFFTLLATLLVGLVIAWIVFLIGSIFIRRSYDQIKLRTNVGLFGTTGVLFLVGAATVIIFIGIIIIFIAQILQPTQFSPPPARLMPQAYKPGGYVPFPPPPPPSGPPPA